MSFLLYREWKKQFSIQVETLPRIAALAKKMGYPGGTTLEDLEIWVQDQVYNIYDTLLGLTERIDDQIDRQLGWVGNWAVDITTVLGNLLGQITNFMARISRTLTDAIFQLNYSIQSTIDIAYSMIRDVLYAMQLYLDGVYKGVEEAIISAYALVEDSFKTMIEWATETLQEFYKNIKGGFSNIADAIVAGIEAIAKVIIAIIDGVAFVISSAIKVLGESIVDVVHSVERMITDILETASTTIEEALTTIGGVMLEISHRVFSFMENIFPDDVNVLADGLAFIFEAQRLAAEKIKATVGGT